MSRAPLPAFHDDLDAALAELWRLLAHGAARADGAFHLPVLATATGGAPRARTVVLRAADREAGALRFHCDRRSAKAAELAADPACALAAYDAPAKVQIRVEGRARLHADDAVAEAAWAAARPMSRVCYGAEPAPGSPLPAGGAYTLPGEGETAGDAAGAQANFLAVVVRAEALEFLYLDRRGHRRAGWRRDGDGWSGRWLAP